MYCTVLCRWANWHQHVAGRVAPSFTENGFEVVQTPTDIFERLSKQVNKGLQDWDSLKEEDEKVQMVYNSEGLAPKFIDMQKLANQVLQELKVFFCTLCTSVVFKYLLVI